MKEFANIELATINSRDLSYLNLVKSRFNAYLSNTHEINNNLLCNPELAIKHIENCIQANLSLAINGDDKLISLIHLMPEDSVEEALQIRIPLIAKFKSILHENGLTEFKYNSTTYTEKLKAIQSFKKNYNGYNQWSHITDEIAHLNCCHNLLIARSILNNIDKLDQAPQINKNKTQLLNTLASQICHYIEIANYISTRISALKTRYHISEQFQGYINEILKIKQECLNNVRNKSQIMLSIPEVEQNKIILFSKYFEKYCFDRESHSDRKASKPYFTCLS